MRISYLSGSFIYQDHLIVRMKSLSIVINLIYLINYQQKKRELNKETLLLSLCN